MTKTFWDINFFFIKLIQNLKKKSYIKVKNCEFFSFFQLGDDESQFESSLGIIIEK